MSDPFQIPLTSVANATGLNIENADIPVTYNPESESWYANDGFAQGPDPDEELEALERGHPSSSSPRPDHWQAPNINETPYWPASEYSNDKKLLDHRTRIETKVEDGKLLVTTVEENLYEAVCFETNDPEKMAGRIIADMYQGGQHVPEEEISINKKKKRVDSLGTAVPLGARVDKEGNLVDALGYRVDEWGFKIDERGNRLLNTYRYVQTDSEETIVYLPQERETLPSGTLLITGQEALEILETTIHYDLSIMGNSVHLMKLQDEKVKLTVAIDPDDSRQPQKETTLKLMTLPHPIETIEFPLPQAIVHQVEASGIRDTSAGESSEVVIGSEGFVDINFGSGQTKQYYVEWTTIRKFADGQHTYSLENHIEFKAGKTAPAEYILTTTGKSTNSANTIPPFIILEDLKRNIQLKQTVTDSEILLEVSENGMITAQRFLKNADGSRGEPIIEAPLVAEKKNRRLFVNRASPQADNVTPDDGIAQAPNSSELNPSIRLENPQKTITASGTITKPGPEIGYAPLDELWNNAHALNDTAREFIATDLAGCWAITSMFLQENTLLKNGSTVTIGGNEYQIDENHEYVNGADAGSVAKTTVKLTPLDRNVNTEYLLEVEYPFNSDPANAVKTKAVCSEFNTRTGEVRAVLDIERRNGDPNEITTQLILTGKSSRFEEEPARVIYVQGDHEADVPTYKNISEQHPELDKCLNLASDFLKYFPETDEQSDELKIAGKTTKIAFADAIENELSTKRTGKFKKPLSVTINGEVYQLEFETVGTKNQTEGNNYFNVQKVIYKLAGQKQNYRIEVFYNRDEHQEVTDRSVTITELDPQGTSARVGLKFNLTGAKGSASPNQLTIEQNNGQKQTLSLILADNPIRESSNLIEIGDFNEMNVRDGVKYYARSSYMFMTSTTEHQIGTRHWVINEIPERKGIQSTSFTEGFTSTSSDGVVTRATLGEATELDLIDQWTSPVLADRHGPYLADYQPSGTERVNHRAKNNQTPETPASPFQVGVGLVGGYQSVSPTYNPSYEMQGFKLAATGRASYQLGKGVVRFQPTALLMAGGAMQKLDESMGYTELHADLLGMSLVTFGGNALRFGIGPLLGGGFSTIAGKGEVAAGVNGEHLDDLSIIRTPQWGGALTAQAGKYFADLLYQHDVVGLSGQVTNDIESTAPFARDTVLLGVGRNF